MGTWRWNLAGTAAVVVGGFGAGDVLAQELLHQWQGVTENDAFGFDVAGAGDVDGDGWGDVLVGASSAALTFGMVYLYSGRTGLVLQSFSGTRNGERLSRVAGMGDLNGDGLDDFLIGAPGAWGPQGPDYGRVDVCYAPGEQVEYSLLGEFTQDSFGAAMMPAGDIDRDGTSDFIVGANDYPSFPPIQKGRAYVYSGKTGSLLYTFTGESGCDFFGTAVDGPGDVNGDGYVDLLVGAVFDEVKGRAYLYSGKDGSLLRTHTGNPGDGLGAGLSRLDDVDYDGHADYLLASNAPNGMGSVTLYSGADGSPVYSVIGEEDPDSFGNHACAGDVNQDGINDFLVSAPQDDPNGRDSGSAFLYSGRNRALLCAFSGQAKNELFGGALDGVGDVNADGFPDFAIGAPVDFGKAYVYAGNDLFLQAGNAAPAPGETLDLFTRGGDPGEQVALFLMEVDGVSSAGPLVQKDPTALFRPPALPLLIGTGVFDSQGHWTASLPLGSALSGKTLGFQSFSRRTADHGRALASLPRAQGQSPPRLLWEPIDTIVVPVQVQ